MQDLAHKEIKGYELLERIGTGGFGAVYRAHQSTVGREVAIKVILPGHANQPEFIRRFEVEAQLVARLEHHHIVPLYDYWRDPEGAYLVMRWLRGGSLYDQIKNHGALSVEDATSMIDQIAGALHTAHRNQVIHRDIKPGNILLDEDGNAFIADFGIAKDHAVAKGVTEADAIVGSPDYLSPEQARSEPVTPQTDIYSLGVVLYEMLEGKHPFPSLSPIERLYKHLNEPLPDVEIVGDEVRDAINDVIQKATAKDPMQRFKDAMEMAIALREAARLDDSAVGTTLVELLTPREQEVLNLVIAGKSNREIADDLVLSLATIKTYVNKIYRKLNVRSRVQAIVKARELDLIVKSTVASESSISHLPEPENPYKGLRAFQAGDAQEFFGRDKLTKKLLKRLQEDVEYRRFLAVVGPSGSGKSSVVKAGLIPALWRGELSGSDSWYIVDLLPGKHPLDELEVALTKVASQDVSNLSEHLSRDERGLVRAANIILPDDGSELLIVIDQFEEVFTLTTDEDEQQHFLDLLRYAVTDDRSRVRVVTTLRADYYDRPLQYPDFGALIQNRTETVLPLNAEELEQAVRQPAMQVSVTFEDGLVSRIVSEVHYQPGALPLLQYALTELFERRNGRKLTLEAYQEIGGTGGALAKRADEIYLEGDNEAQELIRQMFLRLVTLGEGAEDTRRRVDRSELLDIASEPNMMDEIIDLYADSRLLSLDNDPSTRRPTVEVAHEAILREWDRLRGWLNESRDDIRQERLIAQATEAWRTNERDQSYLLTGTRLESVEKWRELTELALTPLVSEFIEVSIRESRVQEIAEAERLEREKAQEERSRTLFRALVAVLAIAAIFSSGFGLFALAQRNEAIATRDEAERVADENQQRALAFASSAAIAQDRQDIAYALGLEAAQNNVLLPDTLRVLDSLSYSKGQRHNFDSFGFCSGWWSPNHQVFGRGEGDCSELVLWDLATNGEIQRLTYPDGVFASFEISPDNQLVFARIETPNDNSYSLWNISTGELLNTLDLSFDRISWYMFAPDSTSLALIEKTGEEIEESPGERFAHNIVLRDLATGAEIRRYVFEGEYLVSLAFSQDGSIGVAGGIADPTGGNARVVVFDVATGDVLQTLERENQSRIGASLVGIDGDNSRIWLSLDDGSKSYIIDLETGEDSYVFDGSIMHTAPELQYVVVDSVHDPQWINMATGEAVKLPSFIATGIYIGYDPTTLLISPEGNLQLWDVFGRDRGDRIVFDYGGTTEAGAMYSPDGNYIATAGPMLNDIFASDQPIYIIDATTGAVVRELNGHAGGIWAIDWSQDGRYIASGAWDDGVVIWDVETGTQIHRLRGFEQPLIDSVQFTPDSRFVLAANGGPIPDLVREVSPFILMWDVETGELVHRINLNFNNPHMGIPGIYITPDSKYALVGVTAENGWFTGEDYVALLDLESGEQISEFDLPGLNIAMALAPDGKTAYSTGITNGDIIEFDTHSGEIIRSWQSPLDHAIANIAISQDGRYLATNTGFGSIEMSISLWDRETGELIRRYVGFPNTAVLLTLDFSPDNRELVATADDGKVRIFPIDEVSALEWILENRYIREFTCAERQLYRIEPYCEG